MKTIFLSVLFFSSITTYSQESISNFFIEDRSAVYKRVFDCPGKSASELKTSLISLFNQTPNIEKIMENGSDLIGSISRMKIDYRKYGGKWGSTSDYLNSEMYANIVIEIKDEKYRVKIKDIYFVEFSDSKNNLVDDRTYLGEVILRPLFGKDQYTKFSNNKTAIESLGFMDSYFSDNFNLMNKSKEKDNW